jgi:AraC family transcriptional regulator
MTEAPKAWEALCRWAGPRNLIRPDSVWFSISNDDPDVTDKARLRYDACLSVGPEVKPEGEIGIVEIPARRAARGRYEGPAAGIAGAWKALYGGWRPDSGFVPADAPAIELYLMDQGNDPEHDHFVMDICVPVVPA